jgi:hypothetical protein
MTSVHLQVSFAFGSERSSAEVSAAIAVQKPES